MKTFLAEEFTHSPTFALFPAFFNFIEDGKFVFRIEYSAFRFVLNLRPLYAFG
jgi:hypothetical protein